MKLFLVLFPYNFKTEFSVMLTISSALMSLCLESSAQFGNPQHKEDIFIEEWDHWTSQEEGEGGGE